MDRCLNGNVVGKIINLEPTTSFKLQNETVNRQHLIRFKSFFI